MTALKKSASLRRLITICPSNDSSPEGEIQIDENTRFYIRKEAETRSRIQYGDKDEPLWPIILGSIFLVILGIVLFFLLD